MATATTRLTTLLQIRSNELHLVALATGLLFFASLGSAIGSPGIEALFYARFGVEFLPVMYIVLGVVTLATSFLMTGLLARTKQGQLYVFLPLILALTLILARFLLIFDFAWLYPILWLGMNLFFLLQFLANWGIASLVCDTRQAKRLFPLFAVGGIVGLSLGSLLTRPIVNVVGTENLILFWGAGLLVAFALAQRLMATSPPTARVGYQVGKPPRLIEELKDGYRIMRGSDLLRWLALAAVLFAILYYALVFPFAQAITLQFPDENELAAFLGTFWGVASGMAILASLFLANRLYARYGFMVAILIYPLIYLVGFSVVTISSNWVALVLFRFVQTFWVLGVTEGAIQGVFNVVPPDRRDKARTFIQGVANQFGVSLAGVMLLLSSILLETQHIYLIGIAAAALNSYFIWRARAGYGSAIVTALRAGQSQIFFSDEEPFGGFKKDATAVNAAVEGIHSPEVAVRRVAAEILGNLDVSEATDALVEALNDEDAAVRAALLRSLGRTGATDALLEVVPHLRDPEPLVRIQAVRTLSRLTSYSRGLTEQLEPLLDDAHPAVRSQAAAALLALSAHPRALTLLRESATGKGATGDEIAGRIFAMQALGEWGGQGAYEIAAEGLDDPSPVVRQTSAQMLARIDPQRCLIPLMAMLGDEDESVRRAVAEALGGVGEPALEMAVAALGDPALEDGALATLEYLPVQRYALEIKAYSSNQVEAARHYHKLSLACRASLTGQNTDIIERGRLLCDVLDDKAHSRGANALWGMALLGDLAAIKLAISNLDSQDANQRANAVEMLDSLGDSKIVKPLLPLWESSSLPPEKVDGWLLDVLQDDDPWLRACGALAAPGMDDPAISEQLKRLARDERESFVRESARTALLSIEPGGFHGQMSGGNEMDTIATLSIMERVLFLRRVPLFADLPPNDLLQIAAVAGEHHYSDGALLANQGEQGSEMYMIVEGEVLVTVTGDDGNQIVLGRRQPGEYVGEMAIISHETRMATLTAQGEVRALCVDQDQFTEILRMRPETSLAVMRVLCQRLRELR